MGTLDMGTFLRGNGYGAPERTRRFVGAGFPGLDPPLCPIQCPHVPMSTQSALASVVWTSPSPTAGSRGVNPYFS